MPSDDQREQQPGLAWDTTEIGHAWLEMEPVHQRTFATATERLIDRAGVVRGNHVLDVAAGTGEQCIALARRVGSSGHVLAVDNAASMLGAASGHLDQLGLSNIVETRVMDAQQLELQPDSFDAAICRFGLMLLPAPAEALRGIRRAIKPGATFAALVWSTQDSNPFQALPFAILQRHGIWPPPQPGQPGPWALSGEDVLGRMLREAGFRDVTVEVTALTWRFTTMEDALAYYRLQAAVLGPQAAEHMSDAGGRQLFMEFAQALEPFNGADGLVVPGEALLGSGAK